MTTTWLPIAISVLSVFVAVLLPRHERGEHRNDIEVEHSNRREEIALLRRQVEQQSEQAKRQEERYEDEDKASLTVSQGSKSGGVSMDAYAFTVTNAGPAVARHVRVELRDASGSAIGSERLRPTGVLTVGTTGEIVVNIPRGLRGHPIDVFVSWADFAVYENERNVGPLEHIM